VLSKAEALNRVNATSRFALIDSLSRWGNAIEEPYAIVPAVLAREWPGSARKVFEGFPESERRAKASILMISTDPQEDNGNPNWPRSYVHTYTRHQAKQDAVNKLPRRRPHQASFTLLRP
jgi:hypothetical protein